MQKKAKLFTGTIENTETGEKIIDKLFVFPRKEKMPNGWISIFQSMTEILAKDKKITGEAHRVLWYLIGKANWGNEIPITQADVAKGLEMNHSNVRRTFKLLVERGILEERGRFGNSKLYALSMDFFWKGDGKAYKKAREGELNVRIDKSPTYGGKAPSSPKSEGKNQTEVA